MTVTQTKSMSLAHLYVQDFYLWLETTANLLKEGKLADIDLENLIEEIESMGRKEKQSLKSNLIVLLMHLLKYQYQSPKRSNSWKYTIREHRRRLGEALADSPSLKGYFISVFEPCYQEARKQASDETGLSLDTFPLESPFSIEETLNPDFLPDAEEETHNTEE